MKSSGSPWSRGSGPAPRTGATAAVMGSLVVLMLGLAYASVPLYRMFCQKTGYGGTTGVATPDDLARIADQAVARSRGAGQDRVIRMTMNTDVAPRLPWTFRACQKAVDVRPGVLQTVAFEVHNRSAEPVTGMAVYNVTPDKMGAFFRKMECFCFEAQTLHPGERRVMPLLFFLDPAMNEDPLLDDVVTITLSYTFFKLPSGAPS